MNEYIRDLQEQVLEFYKKCSSNEAVLTDAVFEQFTKVIVRECCQMNYDYLESYREACEANEKIRQHFGFDNE